MGLFPFRSKQCSAPVANHHHQQQNLNSYSGKPSLISQPSLPSVRTLTLQPSKHFDHSIAILKSNTCSIFSLAISTDTLFSAASDGEIRIWPCHNSCPSASAVVVPARNCAVKSVIVFRNKLITAHQDHKIKVYRIDESESSRLYTLEATLPTLGDRARTMMSARNYVKVRRHVRRTWVHHVDAVSALALSSDNTLLYSVSWDRSLKIWRTSDFKCVESISNAHEDAVNAVVASIDGRIFSASADKTIKVWRKQSIDDNETKQQRTSHHTLLTTLTEHKSAVNALAVSNDGSVLYSGACDRSIIVWECEGMAVMGALRGHTKAILCLTVVGDLVCSGSADGTIRVWRRIIIGGDSWGWSHECLGVLGNHGDGAVKCLAAAEVAAGEYLIYGGSLDGEIRVWNMKISAF